MWLPTFICECGRDLAPGATGQARCAGCGAEIAPVAGVFRCLEDARRIQVQPFLDQYRRVREADGYRVDRSEYYRSLPSVDVADPQRWVWRIRERSFRRLCRELGGRLRSAPSVLDLGAGACWLSYRLATRGCRPVAVDLLVDDRDGLGACRHYDASFPCVQADFDALPFAPGQFDLVIFNGSLHYAPDVATTLRHAASMLNDRGIVAVIDSPMFTDAADGLAMRTRDRERLRMKYGVASPILPGEGFLTFSRLTACAAACGRPSPRFFATHDGWRRRLMRLAAAVGVQRARPARFGVWVAA
jgi:SAM-dependent methyltransferase